MAGELKVGVIIATFNRADSLKSCLDSLSKQTYRNFEVVIIDGGSRDSTHSLIKDYFSKFPVKFIVDERPSLVLARQRGWQEAKGDIVSWIDDDVVVSSQWLEEMVNTFSSSNKIGGVSGPTLIPEDRMVYRDVFLDKKKGFIWQLLNKFRSHFLMEGQAYAVGKIFKSGAWSPGSNYPQCLNLKGLVDVDNLEACNMSIRRELVKKVGGFDEHFKGTSEWCEADLSFRIKRLGYRLVFNAKVVVNHLVSTSGVYQRRTNASERMLNLIYFYAKDIKIYTPDKLVRFFSYLLFLNGYWCYKAITTKNINWITGIAGTIKGLKYLLIKPRL